ncbi:MAG: hypothetical protein ACREND_00665 [Gemmatimonadaceae bacterium]
MSVSAAGLLAALGFVSGCSSSRQLPSEVTAANLRYHATTSTASTHPLVVRAVLTLTNIGVLDTTVEMSASCPFWLEAFTTADRTGAPVWTQAGLSCPAVAQLVSLNSGDTRSFEVTAKASDILGDSLPSGRYFFAAVVTREAGEAIKLAAGQMVLSK